VSQASLKKLTNKRRYRLRLKPRPPRPNTLMTDLANFKSFSMAAPIKVFPGLNWGYCLVGNPINASRWRRLNFIVRYTYRLTFKGLSQAALNTFLGFLYFLSNQNF
jgi:hypothetical protein